MCELTGIYSLPNMACVKMFTSESQADLIIVYMYHGEQWLSNETGFIENTKSNLYTGMKCLMAIVS